MRRLSDRLGVPILDRYLLSELGATFAFGLSAFTLILAANSILNVGRLVSQEHAPLWAAVLVFVWTLPGEVVLVIPMALLLGTLLAMQRLSGESEVTAMQAGGITFWRIVTPFLAAGLAVSGLTYVLQEHVVPFAQDQVSEIEGQVISHTSIFNRDLTVSAALPSGGHQVTVATSYEPHTRALLNVTLVQYDADNKPIQVAFAQRADFAADKWVLENASIYRFNADGTTISEPAIARQQVELGENPTDIVKRIQHDDPETMSRAQIADIIRTGQLTRNELQKYVATYQEKLAQPFACFVFVLIALPFAMQSRRGGGSVSLGFGLAVAIIFVYYIVMTIFSYVGDAFSGTAWIWAWMPNLLFTAIGFARLRRVASV